jgi:CheY-like chemotaxis protein
MEPSQPTVLVVDNHLPSQRVIRLMLEDEGYRVIVASSLSAARRALEAAAPDLVVCDLIMPLTPSFALLDLLDANPRWRTIPVVLCTAAVRELSQAGERLTRGHIEVVHKPFEITELLNAVARLLALAADSQCGAPGD